MALSVDRGNTPADAIPIMYDHPNYPTRIEVDTKTPIEGEEGLAVAAAAAFAFLGGLLAGSFVDGRRAPGAARRVDRRAALALPRLRRADRRLRQRPGPLLGCCCAGGRAAAARRSRPATR